MASAWKGCLTGHDRRNGRPLTTINKTKEKKKERGCKEWGSSDVLVCLCVVLFVLCIMEDKEGGKGVREKDEGDKQSKVECLSSKQRSGAYHLRALAMCILA